jgi:hypothetical protein
MPYLCNTSLLQKRSDGFAFVVASQGEQLASGQGLSPIRTPFKERLYRFQITASDCCRKAIRRHDQFRGRTFRLSGQVSGVPLSPLVRFAAVSPIPAGLVCHELRLGPCTSVVDAKRHVVAWLCRVLAACTVDFLAQLDTRSCVRSKQARHVHSGNRYNSARREHCPESCKGARTTSI